MSVSIRKTSVAELEATPNFQDVLDQYAAVSQMTGMPPATAQLETYRKLESVGVLHVFGAFHDYDHLAGFITVLISELPHYGVSTAVCESFFVAEHMRNTGAGLKLKGVAEEFSRSVGAKGMFISAAVNSDLDRMMSALHGYTATNRIYFKSFGDAHE